MKIDSKLYIVMSISWVMTAVRKLALVKSSSTSSSGSNSSASSRGILAKRLHQRCSSSVENGRQIQRA